MNVSVSSRSRGKLERSRLGLVSNKLSNVSVSSLSRKKRSRLYPYCLYKALIVAGPASVLQSEPTIITLDRYRRVTAYRCASFCVNLKANLRESPFLLLTDVEVALNDLQYRFAFFVVQMTQIEPSTHLC